MKLFVEVKEEYEHWGTKRKQGQVCWVGDGEYSKHPGSLQLVQATVAPESITGQVFCGVFAALVVAAAIAPFALAAVLTWAIGESGVNEIDQILKGLTS